MPKIYHPFISANDEIEAIIAQGTMRLNMPPPSVESSEISIIGEKDVVLRAKELILDLASELVSSCTLVLVCTDLYQCTHLLTPPLCCPHCLIFLLAFFFLLDFLCMKVCYDKNCRQFYVFIVPFAISECTFT